MVRSQLGGFLKAKDGILGQKFARIIDNDLIEKEKITAVIDKRYPLERTTESFRYVEKGHQTGSVVIALKQN